MPLIDNDDFDELSIERMIFHIIKDGETPAEFLPSLKPAEVMKFATFFLSLIKGANRGSRFKFSRDSSIADWQQIENGAPQAFVASSKRLAELFRRAHTGATSPGVIIFFRLRLHRRTYSAVIKHDYQDVIAFRHRGDEITLPQIKENIVRSPHAMQKCALIDLTAGDNGELVADDLSGRVRRLKITNYFRAFLGVDPVHDDVQLSVVVHDFLVDTVEHHRAELPDEIYRHRRRRIFDVIDSQDCLETENLESIVLRVTGPLEGETRARVVETFRQKLRRQRIEDERIALTTSALQRPRKRRVRTTEGIQILYDAEQRSLIRRVRTQTGERITIETTEITAWDEDDPAERSRAS